MRSPVIRSVFPMAILALCFLAGCGSSGPTTSKGSGTNTQGACGLVSSEEVEKAIGQHVGSGEPATPTTGPPTCTYSSEGKPLVVVGFDASNAPEDMKAFERAISVLGGGPGSNGVAAETVAGLGDHVYWYEPGAWLVVVRGNEYLSVSDGELPQETTKRLAIALAKIALSH